MPSMEAIKIPSGKLNFFFEVCKVVDQGESGVNNYPEVFILSRDRYIINSFGELCGTFSALNYQNISLVKVYTAAISFAPFFQQGQSNLCFGKGRAKKG